MAIFTFEPEVQLPANQGYIFEITDCSRHEINGKQAFKIKHKILVGDEKGNFHEELFFYQSAKWRLVSFMEALGFTDDFDIDDPKIYKPLFVGTRFEAAVEHSPSKKDKNKIYVNIMVGSITFLEEDQLDLVSDIPRAEPKYEEEVEKVEEVDDNVLF